MKYVPSEANEETQAPTECSTKRLLSDVPEDVQSPIFSTTVGSGGVDRSTLRVGPCASEPVLMVGAPECHLATIPELDYIDSSVEDITDCNRRRTLKQLH